MKLPITSFFYGFSEEDLDSHGKEKKVWSVNWHDLIVKKENVCKEVDFTPLNIKIVEDFLLQELGRVDVILKMQWLEFLGSMYVKWKS